MQRTVMIGLALGAGLYACTGLAQEQPTYDRVNLSASVEREVANDLLVAVVYAEAEDNDQADAADAVNKAIQWAADRARAARDIELETAQYTTRPVYAPNSRRISGWIARQSLRLESGDPETLSELLGRLQERVAVQSIAYQLSKPARDAAEEALIAEAIAAFKRRAGLIAGEFGQDGYRLVRLNVNTSGFVPSRNEVRSFALSADAAQVAAPEIEAGVQTVTVSVDGIIELGERP